MQPGKRESLPFRFHTNIDERHDVTSNGRRVVRTDDAELVVNNNELVRLGAMQCDEYLQAHVTPTIAQCACIAAIVSLAKMYSLSLPGVSARQTE